MRPLRQGPCAPPRWGVIAESPRRPISRHAGPCVAKRFGRQMILHAGRCPLRRFWFTIIRNFLEFVRPRDRRLAALRIASMLCMQRRPRRRAGMVAAVNGRRELIRDSGCARQSDQYCQRRSASKRGACAQAATSWSRRPLLLRQSSRVASVIRNVGNPDETGKNPIR